MEGILDDNMVSPQLPESEGKYLDHRHDNVGDCECHDVCAHKEYNRSSLHV